MMSPSSHCVTTPGENSRLGWFICLALLVLADASAVRCGAAELERSIYLFSSFKEPANEGLRFLWSEDGLAWRRIPGVFLKPALGDSPIMRDPSIARGPDGLFRLVYTSAWRGDQGFGYAESSDLVHWSQQRFLPVMQHEPTTVNVWAPEVWWDESKSEFIIAWASTIPGRYPDGLEDPKNNHRMYYTRTKDFKQLAPAKLFCEPGFSVIDAVVVRVEDQQPAYRLVLKDNTRPVLGLRVAKGDSPTGPWRAVSDPITGFKTEGPSVARVGDRWLIYFDSYNDHRYKALETTNFEQFSDVSQQVHFPPGHKHGTVLRVTRDELEQLLEVGRFVPQDTPPTEPQQNAQNLLNASEQGAGALGVSRVQQLQSNALYSHRYLANSSSAVPAGCVAIATSERQVGAGDFSCFQRSQ